MGATRQHDYDRVCVVYRDRAKAAEARVTELEAELVTVYRDLVTAREEIARTRRRQHCGGPDPEHHTTQEDPH